MERIKRLKDEMLEEIESAKEYAEEYLTFKSRDESVWASRYKEMATDELKHASYIHERVMEEINTLSKVYTPPEEMMKKWESDHRIFIEKVAWIKQMLAM